MTNTEKKKEILHKSQLVEYFEQGSKSADKWGIGTEHEKFLFHKSNFKRLSYSSKPGICTILKHIRYNGWQPITERGNIIGLKKNGASITLEPGGQFELSGKNFKTVQETFIETKKHFQELNAICEKFNFFSLPLGVDPLSAHKDVPWMPKERYLWMKKYMPCKGKLGLEMMTNTASIQVNLDYGSEIDMVKKMRIAQALQPIVTAIFANSPISAGKPNGYLSYRTHIWNHTDPDRCGFLPFIFDEGFGFERWVDYLLDVPMYFIHRDGEYLPANTITFRDFLQGKHQLKPVMEDWVTHVSTVFPDVRLKQFIEMRGADAGCVSHIAALPALWVGLLYDSNSLNEAYDLISGWDIETIREVRSLAPVKGLNASSGNMHVGKIASQIYHIALAGLTNRSKVNCTPNEGLYLEPVRKITESGITQAEKFLKYYNDNFQEDMEYIVYTWQELQMQNCPDL